MFRTGIPTRFADASLSVLYIAYSPAVGVAAAAAVAKLLRVLRARVAFSYTIHVHKGRHFNETNFLNKSFKIN